ncbi:hypothetical protein [Kutzneria buriramensis]|uniref:Uncharacterized protein n=1 Tax=Kutzneria buriramensis TaxID=1045776 RepID=A0A3E0GUG1_9PSEU|nr:hypothetical protein [Kutzneria buriramensis]REH26002.1 hypothetical protein BCF44_13541 [Kutzneria buriramensis]
MAAFQQHLFQHPDGRLIFTRFDNHDLGTSAVELFLGASGALMPRVTVTEIEVVRDGGSLYFITAEGIVFIPVWGGQPAFFVDADDPGTPLIALDPTTVVITESTAVVITSDADGENS